MARTSSETDCRSVPAHHVQRRWGEVADDALRSPLVITAKGRPRHVLMAFDEYQRLKARDRQAHRIDELPDELASALEAGLSDLRGPDGGRDDGDTVIR